jgi:hypothetical protein
LQNIHDYKKGVAVEKTIQKLGRIVEMAGKIAEKLRNIFQKETLINCGNCGRPGIVVRGGPQFQQFFLSSKWVTKILI